MKFKPKYTQGLKMKIVGDSTAHQRPIGSTVVIAFVDHSDPHYTYRGVEGYWFGETDIAPLCVTPGVDCVF